MDFIIPRKSENVSEVYAHSTNINPEKTIKFARVKEILGGYTNQEILELLIDNAIEAYYDGKDPSSDMLPKKLKGATIDLKNNED